jgi:hypothetical protein
MKTIKPHTRFRRVIETIGIFLSVAVVMYGFLALCNWSPYLKDWSGFSRFLMGVWGVIFVIRIIDDV